MAAEPTPIEARASEETQRPDPTPPIIGVARKEDDPQQQQIPDVLPILPLRNIVIFPGTVLPLTVGRPASRKMLEESLPQSKVIGLFAQKNPEQDNPGPLDLHRVGVAALVLKLLRQGEDNVVIVIQALRRITLRRVLSTEPY